MTLRACALSFTRMAESGLGEELAWRVVGALGGGGGDGVVPLKVRPPKVKVP